MKLLLVEDNRKMVEALGNVLKTHGYAVDTALDGETALEMAVSGVYDIIILDRMLPRMDGMAFLK